MHSRINAIIVIKPIATSVKQLNTILVRQTKMVSKAPECVSECDLAVICFDPFFCQVCPLIGIKQPDFDLAGLVDSWSLTNEWHPGSESAVGQMQQQPKTRIIIVFAKQYREHHGIETTARAPQHLGLPRV